MENVTPTQSNREFDPVVGTFDAGNDVGTTSLWGFLGPASDEMYRLYTDVSFSKFYEIPKAKIVWTEAGQDDGDVTPTRVVVAGDTEWALSESTSAGTYYLDGTITAGYLPNGAEQQAQLACGNVTTTLVCTLAGAQGGTGNDAALCITLYTAVPTWCYPTARCTGGSNDRADCGNVLTTLVCTLPAEVQAHDGKKGCLEVLGTTVCTVAREQLAQADGGCGDVLKTLVCTLAAAGQVAAGNANQCGEVLTTMVCTLAVANNAAQHCFAVTTTIACTIAADQVVPCATYITARPSGCALPGGAGNCGNVLGTIVCTLAPAAVAGCDPITLTLACTAKNALAEIQPNAARGCGEVLGTAVCTLAAAGAQQVGCGEVLTTLACTFANAAQAGPARCGDVLGTIVCTLPNARAQAGCIAILQTAVCTVGSPAAPLRPVNCGQILATFVCTIGYEAQVACATYITARPTVCGGQPAANARCGNVLTTLACTLAAPEGANAAADCKDVLWTAGCTFQRAADCKDVLWTAGCTFAAAKAVPGAADCKNVLWTAGCTFAAQARAQAGCKDVLWTAGCTFAGAADCKDVLWTAGCTFAAPAAIPAPRNGCVVVTTTLFGCTFAGGGAVAADCKNVLWTAGCTFAGTQPQGRCWNRTIAPSAYTCTVRCPATMARAAECKDVLWTAGCTFAPQARVAATIPLCITLYTAVPTWCQQPCGIVPTIPPTHCDPGPCGIVPTIPPTHCGGQYYAGAGANVTVICLDYVTANPTMCGGPGTITSPPYC